MSLERSQRKRRVTQKEIKDFALWALTEGVYEKYTCGKIQQLYKQINKDVELTTCTIRLQKDRWVLIDGKVYDVNKKYMFPK